MASGLSFVPKLRKDHVHLTSYSRMKVNLATQVSAIHTYIRNFIHNMRNIIHIMSSGTSVANAMEYFQDEKTLETREFIRHFDRFFDCMNVRCTSEAV